MKQYLLNICQPDGGPPAPDILEPILRDLAALRAEMQEAGAWAFTAALHPAHEAAVVRPPQDGDLVVDGPFVESKEHVGGFVVIRAADRDAALGWARKLAKATTLPIELREMRADNG